MSKYIFIIFWDYLFFLIFELFGVSDFSIFAVFGTRRGLLINLDLFQREIFFYLEMKKTDSAGRLWLKTFQRCSY